MKTPIIDFVEEYKAKSSIRMHMPGHKGKKLLGFEDNDITEIDGADVLYDASGVILESEKNASDIFDCDTFYSAEGSSLAIRAMLYLALSNRKNREQRPFILAARNVHKTFVTAASLLDFDVEWLYSSVSASYHTCIITASDVLEALKNAPYLPFAVYVTSPDYLGNILDIKAISKVCNDFGIPLLVDNAHGAYLKFLNESLFPIDLGATMASSSSHKTLPCLTGGAYLSINKNADSYYKEFAKEALALFASTSPSYLILESLDYVNKFIATNKNIYEDFCSYLGKIKCELTLKGYTLVEQEKMKLAIDAKAYGYTGVMMNEYLSKHNIAVEFYDEDYLVLMPSPLNDIDEVTHVKEVLLGLEKKAPLAKKLFEVKKKKQAVSIKEAMFSLKEKIDIDDALNRILASTAVTCPPAVPIVVCGEVIDKEDISLFKYYGINTLSVIKK